MVIKSKPSTKSSFDHPMRSAEEIWNGFPKELKEKLGKIDALCEYMRINPDKFIQRQFIRNIQIRSMYDSLTKYTSSKYGEVLKAIEDEFQLSRSRIKNILTEYKKYQRK